MSRTALCARPTPTKTCLCTATGLGFSLLMACTPCDPESFTPRCEEEHQLSCKNNQEDRQRCPSGCDEEVGFCIVCGFETLVAECGCGRPFDYALAEPENGGLHCPRCGRDWRGRKSDW